MSRKTKVLFLIPTLSAGGAQRVFMTLLRHFDRNRFDIILGVVDRRGDVYAASVPTDIRVIDFESSRVRYALPKILRTLWTERPDVVLSTLGHLNLWLCAVKPLFPPRCRLLARESIVVSQSIAMSSMAGVRRGLYRVLYPFLDHLVCQSTDMFEDMVHAHHFPRGKASIINNPVDVDDIALRSNSSNGITNWRSSMPGHRHLVAAGRLDYQKGFDLLIAALARCADLPLTLTILGEGPLKSQLLAQAEQLGVAARVHIEDYQNNPFAWYAAADAYVLSSRFEGFPNVLLEAMSCGTPVIALPAPGGINDILCGRSDCLIAREISSDALAEALRTWAGQPLQRIPKEAMRPYRVERIVAAYEDLVLAVA